MITKYFILAFLNLTCFFQPSIFFLDQNNNEIFSYNRESYLKIVGLSPDELITKMEFNSDSLIIFSTILINHSKISSSKIYSYNLITNYLKKIGEFEGDSGEIYTQSKTHNKILFSSNIENCIKLVNLNIQSNSTEILNEKDSWNPSISPNGNNAIYISEAKLFLIDLMTKQKKNVIDFSKEIDYEDSDIRRLEIENYSLKNIPVWTSDSTCILILDNKLFRINIFTLNTNESLIFEENKITSGMLTFSSKTNSLFLTAYDGKKFNELNLYQIELNNPHVIKLKKITSGKFIVDFKIVDSENVIVSNQNDTLYDIININLYNKNEITVFKHTPFSQILLNE